MSIQWETEVAITPVSNIGNTWTDIVDIDVNALGPTHLQIEADNQSGSVTDAVEIRLLGSNKGTAEYDDEPIGGFSFQPSDTNPRKPPSYVIPGVYHRVRIQAQSFGPTDQYTVGGTYRRVDVNAA